MNKTMMMLTAPMLFAFLITAVFGLRESTRAQGNSTDAKRPESAFACNRSALTPQQRKRHFDELGPKLVSLKKSVRELPNGYEFEFAADSSTFQLVAELEELEEMGIDSIREIPDDFELSEIQRRAATCVQTGERWFSPELVSELANLKYPVRFMDFETVNWAIPRFAGMRPYDHLPFQFSVHVQRQPSTEPEQHEFLATDARDPRREFISSLCHALGESGSIVVYSSFESQRLSDLAVWLPEHAERINAIQARLFDLLPVVREHVYHPAFAGSYSIKSVLPALVPDMSYDGMQVANGQAAGVAWESLVHSGLNCNEHERIEKALRAYCAQDTLALVRLVEKLQCS